MALPPLSTAALRVVHLAGQALAGLGELVLPILCAACGEPTRSADPFCETCALSVEAVETPCPRCALPLPPPPGVAPLAPLPPPRPTPTCLGCLAAPPPWTEARAPLAFAGSLAIAVRRFKLHPQPALAHPLGDLLAPSLARFALAHALVPVPLHPARLRAREFNQASLLCRAARRRARSPVPVEELLDRVRDTPPQLGQSAKERRANLRQAFAVAPRARVAGRHLVVVDDVITTGATAAACTAALLAAGAARVDVLALARTLP
jgi:ComF family protein